MNLQKQTTNKITHTDLSDYNDYKLTPRNHFSKRVHYINKSGVNLHLKEGDGVAVEIPNCRYGTGNNLMVVVTYELGPDVCIPWRDILNGVSELHQPALDQLKLQYENAVKQKVTHANTIEFFYEIDISELPMSPHGFYVPALNIHVYDSRFANNAIHYAQSGLEELDRHTQSTDQRLSGAATRRIAYFVNDPKIHKRVIMTGPHGEQLLISKYSACMPEGVHIYTDGNFENCTGKPKITVLHIRPSEFRENGIFHDFQELRDHQATNNKTLGKEKADQILKRLEQWLNFQPAPESAQPEKRTKKFVERELFNSGITTGEVLEFTEWLNKLTDSVTSIVSKVKGKK